MAPIVLWLSTEGWTNPSLKIGLNVQNNGATYILRKYEEFIPHILRLSGKSSTEPPNHSEIT
jgi:hypothetical protein